MDKRNYISVDFCTVMPVRKAELKNKGKEIVSMKIKCNKIVMMFTGVE